MNQNLNNDKSNFLFHPLLIQRKVSSMRRKGITRKEVLFFYLGQSEGGNEIDKNTKYYLDNTIPG